MMSLVIGLTNLAVGLAYAGLGLLSVWETVSLHRYRGWSRFGIGFAMMAASCGPHHLVHGWHVLAGEAVTLPMLAVTLIGLPAGLIFVLLRLETVFGGQGERMIAVSPDRVAMVVGGLTAVAGVLAVRTERRILTHLRGGDLELEWSASGHVFLTGPADEVFEGVWPR